MDPITAVITNALGNIVSEVVKNGYIALKTTLQQKYGKDSELLEAIDKLEKKPESTARKEMVKEEVEAAKADQDPKILKLAHDLLDILESQSTASTIIKQQAGDNSIQIGQVGRDINAES